LVVKVTAASGSVSNTASVATAVSDPFAANNSATVVTNITTPGALSGTVCAGAAPPCPQADTNGDGVIDAADLDPLVASLFAHQP
jgi:hypothetical protein